MVSHEHRCIFIHIPKTGGTSVEKALGHFEVLERGVQDHKPLREIEPLSGIEEARYLVNRYALQKNVLYNPPVSRKQFKSYFKFAFVRNPWDRVFSWYRNTLRDEKHRKALNIPEDCDFDYYLSHFLDQWMLQPQINWLLNKRGEIDVNFIGRFERLEEDYEHIKQTLGLDAELPKLLHYDRFDYTEAYTKKSKKTVGDFYTEEVELFKYRFEA